MKQANGKRGARAKLRSLRLDMRVAVSATERIILVVAAVGSFVIAYFAFVADRPDAAKTPQTSVSARGPVELIRASVGEDGIRATLRGIDLAPESAWACNGGIMIPARARRTEVSDVELGFSDGMGYGFWTIIVTDGHRSASFQLDLYANAASDLTYHDGEHSCSDIRPF